jgi:galactosamine-6-phosphate isomerase
MTIIECNNYQEMSAKAAELVHSIVITKPDALLCCATGHSPTGLYVNMVNDAKSTPHLFDQIRILQLDEWLGLSKDSSLSCNAYLKAQLIDPLSIDGDRSYSFDTQTDDMEAECHRVEAIIEKSGPIDICILGLGKNGHLGFNEPADHLKYQTHIATLSTETVNHDMVKKEPSPLKHGLTIGMKGIMSSRKIILLVSGEGKAVIFKEWQKRRITPRLPASFLCLHSDLYVFIDKTSL